MNCDEDCNLLACRYDDGDCDGRESNLKDYKNGLEEELFYPSIDFTNILLNTKLKMNNRNCFLRQFFLEFPVFDEKHGKMAKMGPTLSIYVFKINYDRITNKTSKEKLIAITVMLVT